MLISLSGVHHVFLGKKSESSLRRALVKIVEEVFSDLREQLALRVFEPLFGSKELHSSKEGSAN